VPAGSEFLSDHCHPEPEPNIAAASKFALPELARLKRSGTRVHPRVLSNRVSAQRGDAQMQERLEGCLVLLWLRMNRWMLNFA